MKKELQQYSQLSDGSHDLGNGIVGPSLSDKEYFNNPLREESKRNRLIIPVTAVLGLIAAACGGSKNIHNPQSETSGKEDDNSSGYELPFPKGETWFLTGGPHADGLSNGVRYAIDIAPPEGGSCPTDGSRLVIENRIVTASASGQVIVAGDDKNRNDPSHSIVKVKNPNGLTEDYIHLANIKVKKGDKISQGASLGNPSCEYPPGGRNEGPHVHEGLEKDGQAIPIDGVVLGEWTIHNQPRNYDGTMTKTGEKTRTADTGRCADDKVCGGIRNDLPNPSNKTVVAGPKDPILPISGKVNEKSVSNPIEKPAEKGWTRFRSFNYPYEIDVPYGWTKDNIELGGKLVDVFRGETVDDFQTNVSISSEPVNSWVRPEDYTNDILAKVRQIDPEASSTLESDITSIKKLKKRQEMIDNKLKSPDTEFDREEKEFTERLLNTKAAGQKTYLIWANINGEYDVTKAVFLLDRKGWQITLFHLSYLKYYGIPTHEKEDLEFLQMLDSFNFLK